MLKPIHRVVCSPALAACQELMRRFTFWLCDPTTTLAEFTQQGLQPPVLATAIEADWLWSFLQRETAKQSLLSRARVLVTMPAAQKASLADWVRNVVALAAQFQPGAAPFPTIRPLADSRHWEAFKELMEAFYEKGLRHGLPYLANGTPTRDGGVTYAEFVAAFRDAHRLNPLPDAYEVCVLCGGHLGETPHVDHWITKSTFPLLSVCADNLQLICSTCNVAPNKGEKHVHSNGSFADWFHPYLRPGDGALLLEYVLPELTVRCSTRAAGDHAKGANLDSLLNLSRRWTREFKAQYAARQGDLRRLERKRIAAGQPKMSLVDLQNRVQEWVDSLSPTEPHNEVYQVLGQALAQPDRVQALLADLASIT
ncbi:hypothetical protein [Burkholderia ubonensis]|uniref:hypothetical protein n=1 Tax=Burkholderia ubonensis TaxID=101571 RepID=UPI0009B42868|nr:hypothetical protein [Burkholderia ubonensis]